MAPPPGRTFAPHEHIVVDAVTKRFGDKEVLRGVDLVVERGKTTVILGGSGAGKTTLLRLLIALERPTEGRIWVDGEDIVPLSETQLNKVRQKFGMVFQYAALLDSLTVMENVAFPLREHTKKSGKEIRDEVRAMLEILGLAGNEERFPSELSGGMRKRVGLARALMLRPQIIIYDEPTSGLDPHTSRMVDDLIEEMRERFRVTNVVISHDIASTYRIAHHAFLLVNGRVAAAGKPDEIARTGTLEARSFLEASGVAPDRISRPPDA